MLRKIRLIVALVSFVMITLLFLDFTGTLHTWFGWLAKIQFLPAVLALNVGVILLWVVLTLVFGRVYCSVICPLGVFQDIVSWFSGRRPKKKYRFSYSPAVSWLRYGVLGVFVIAVIAGIGSVVALLAPYSSYGRIASNLFAPVYQWGNNEAQYYTSGRKENAWVSDGVLRITALKEPMEGRSYTSARLITKGKGDWLYGRFEIRAKLPTGRGTWPAIWMLPTDWEYGDWPKSGEIDIMENVGYDPDTIVGSSHTEKYNHAIGTQKNAKIACPDCYKAFHVYALEWEEDEYRLYVDDQLYFTFKNEGIGYEVWPYDKRFHILLNLAIGGNWGGQKGIDDSLFPHVFEIDYVRVYKK